MSDTFVSNRAVNQGHKDLDLRNPVYRKPLRRPGFETTTAEVLKKADFRICKGKYDFEHDGGSSPPANLSIPEDSSYRRETSMPITIIKKHQCRSSSVGRRWNVRFLANFITESGIIIKRRKTGISAKAQRKVAREIKTARAFGLMPFTTMGTKTFIFGKTMEDTEEDYEFDKSGPRFTGAKETPF
ncbi:hypothetical protein QJS10_CPB04g01443 [Acorus calamus]|uniref:Small ribosomal subunit protein bS18c n=1 Tax=Acorus calamus TaxID=4465 RepID=A0AAV9F5I5_ACOCL|nr:hypothetical protein QJS10_CPB04g01443 [Acorus calamus]